VIENSPRPTLAVIIQFQDSGRGKIGLRNYTYIPSPPNDIRPWDLNFGAGRPVAVKCCMASSSRP